MIKVYPLYNPKNLDRSLTTQYIFKDSKGKRQTLNPAESMDDAGKTPQLFDGGDFAVATEIMKHLQDKTVKVSAEDMKILKATLAAGPPAAAGSKPDTKATKAEVKTAVADALAESDEAHKTAMSEASDAAAEAQAKAVNQAIDGANAESAQTHSTAMAEASDAASGAKDDAVQEALATATDDHDKAMSKLQADHDKALARAGK